MAKNDGGVSVSPENLRSKRAEIASIDEWLDSVSGGASAGKTAIKNALVKDGANSQVIEQMVSSITNWLNDNNAGEDVRAAIYFGITKNLDTTFKDSADKYITAAAEANKSNVETVTASDDEILAKRDERKTRVNEFNALKGILEMFGMEDSITDIEDPKPLRGAIKGQTRGPRLINQMKFTVDGTPLAEDKNTLSGVAESIGGGIKAKQVRAALKEAGVNTAKPSDFSVEIAGKLVVGTGGTAVADDSQAA